jgi:hypothetical protein
MRRLISLTRLNSLIRSDARFVDPGILNCALLQQEPMPAGSFCFGSEAARQAIIVEGDNQHSNVIHLALVLLGIDDNPEHARSERRSGCSMGASAHSYRC